ncbi:KipI family sensor histidine kinase inhibitor [Williamsia limnetica]|uniref:KipI family sensor histidine kinase inhibitor n=1 Tax=Williamsia limnetica TaxID=882452 RepID=A0A318RM96_WILLI|nr:allophanate hydrolase subunit 1 [Williamsia limnetica]PYE19432.1 KipI family sensor histidine kinase inhibitor [Williamsia limnetica]
MNLLPYGDRALLLEVADTDEVIGWVTAIRDADLPGVLDLIPGARTVLVVGDDPRAIPRLHKELKAMSPSGTTTLDDGPVIEVPVVYDGPDLEDIARLTGLDVDEVVAAHTGTPWKVAFGGFAPGFAYLVGGDNRLQVPRRDTSRTKVPAGAVGLAGEFSGIYPRSSPGGWQLLGHTDLPMWDVDRDPPALLQPGVRVQFRRAES